MKRYYYSLALLVGLIAFSQIQISAAERIRFQIGIDSATFQTAKQPVSGRLLVFMTNQTRPFEMIEPDFLNPRAVWIAGMEVRNVTPGQTIDFDPDTLAFPAPFSTAPSGDYQLMALLDTDHSYTYNGAGLGDLYSAVVTERKLNPASSGAIKLTLTKQVPERKLADTDSIKLVSFESPSLSTFWGRAINMRAGVVLPPSYAKSKTQSYPTVYEVHGYGGTHLAAWRRGSTTPARMLMARP